MLYNWHIERLKDSLIDHGIESYIEEIPRCSDWSIHVNYKPVFILKCLEMFDENIVWLDADAVVQQYPVLFDDMDADIAVHYKDNKEMLAGTIYVSNTDNGKKLIKEWVDMCVDKRHNEQPMLQHMLKESDYTVCKLPAPYTLIFDTMKAQGPPVIEHFQASRKGRTM
jgi:hypothetical protein